MLKNIVKMVGENQVENIVLYVSMYLCIYVSMFSNLYSNQEVSELMINIQENKWLSGIKIARIIEPGLNIHNLIETMAKKLSLLIKISKHAAKLCFGCYLIKCVNNVEE
jgi:hypothetical protein